MLLHCWDSIFVSLPKEIILLFVFGNKKMTLYFHSFLRPVGSKRQSRALWRRERTKRLFLLLSCVPLVASGKAERSGAEKEGKETYFFTTIQPSLS